MKKKVLGLTLSMSLILGLTPAAVYAGDTVDANAAADTNDAGNANAASDTNDTSACENITSADTYENADFYSKANIDADSEAPLFEEAKTARTFAASDIAINEENFPDPIFRKHVSEKYDADSDGILSQEEWDKVTFIDCSTLGIADLTGIEFFTSLVNLDCSTNNLKALDLSGNPDLSILDCHQNQLTSLNVSKNARLGSMDCGFNQLTTLDVSSNTMLTYLRCTINKLTTLDVSHNIFLTTLLFSTNRLTSIDLDKNILLQQLSFEGNQYPITVNENFRTFNLSNLPGNFDVSRASDWVGGHVEGNTLVVDENAASVTYTYDSKRFSNLSFTLTVTTDSSEPADYQILEGADGTWKTNDPNGLTFKGSGSSREFTQVLVDHNLVDVNNYSLSGEDAAVVTLSPEYLASLAIGNHTIELFWTDGAASTSFTIVKGSTSSGDSGNTGDKNNEETANTTRGFVTRLYRNVLGRTPDKAGCDAWVNVLETGKNGGEEAAKGFIFSSEYINKGTGNDAFVEMLYNTLLNRKSDANGRKAWVKLLEEGKEDREGIVEGFIHSVEFNKICEQYGIFPTAAEAFASRLYTKCLGRDYDKAGLKAWGALLHSRAIGGGEAAKGFFFSREFQNQNVSDEEFVTRCYRTFLNREPDASGLRDWVRLLQNSQNKEAILDGFIGSDEYGELCISYGINR